MNTWAAAGVKCVCINDDWGYLPPFLNNAARLPMINEVLTIKSVSLGFSPHDFIAHVGLTFAETPLPFGVLFAAANFRQLVSLKDDVRMFREIAHRMTPTERLDRMLELMDDEE